MSYRSENHGSSENEQSTTDTGNGLGSPHSELGAGPSLYEGIAPSSLQSPCQESDGMARSLSFVVSETEERDESFAHVNGIAETSKNDLEETRQSDGQQHQKAKQNRDDVVTAKQLYALIKRQRFRCAYTDDQLIPNETGADHKVPVARGGNHSLANIAIVTRAVNSAKGTMTLDEFVLMCRKVVRKFGMGEE